MEATKLVIRNLQRRGYEAVLSHYVEYATGNMLSSEYKKGVGIFWVVGEVPPALKEYVSPSVTPLSTEMAEKLNTELKMSIKTFTRPG